MSAPDALLVQHKGHEKRKSSYEANGEELTEIDRALTRAVKALTGEKLDASIQEVADLKAVIIKAKEEIERIQKLRQRPDVPSDIRVSNARDAAT